MSLHDKYREMPIDTLTNRTFVSLINFLLLFVINFILVLFCSIPILQNNKDYKESNTRLFDSIYSVYKLQEDANLAKLKENSKKECISSIDFYNLYIWKQVKTVYFLNSDYFNDNGVSLEVSEEDLITTKTDELTFYYVNYKYENSINLDDYENLNPKDYFIDSIFSKYDSFKYYDINSYQVPLIKKEKILDIYKYLIDETSNNDTYFLIYDDFNEINYSAKKDLTNFTVYKNHMAVYEQNLKSISTYQNLSLVITFIISYSVLMIILRLFNKDRANIGELIFHSRCVYEKNEKCFLIIEILINLLLKLPIIILVSAFTFGLVNLLSPIFNIGSFSVNLLHILLFIFAFSIINFTFTVIRNDRKSGINVLLNSEYYNIKNFISSSESGLDSSTK